MPRNPFIPFVSLRARLPVRFFGDFRRIMRFVIFQVCALALHAAADGPAGLELFGERINTVPARTLFASVDFRYLD
jgi:hypothetical protein